MEPARAFKFHIVREPGHGKNARRRREGWGRVSCLLSLARSDMRFLCRMLCTKFNRVDLSKYRVLPPMESKDKNVWPRGSFRDTDFNELIVTGPRLPLVFSGCRFNNLVFAMKGPADEAAYAFEEFLHRVLSMVETAVDKDPTKFMGGIKNRNILVFDRDFVRPSTYSADEPNEFKVRLAVKRNQLDEHGEVVDMIDAEFVDAEGVRVNPEDLRKGDEIMPIMRVGYHRNANKFALTFTLLRGKVFPSLRKRKSMDIAELQFDEE